MPIIASAAIATIANGASASDAIAIAGIQNLSVWMPDSWTAANLAIQVARTESPPAAGDWRTVTDPDGEVSLPAAANRVLLIPASTMIPNGARWVRFISGSVGTPVNQGASRALTVERRAF